MAATTPTGNRAGNGRVSSELFADLAGKIRSGEFAPGSYLPTVRELSDSHSLARKTVNGVLKRLQAEEA